MSGQDLKARSTVLPKTATGKRVMVVDDEHDIVYIFVRALELKGYSVIGFSDPAKALMEFRNNPTQYDLVISDIRMPTMSGTELVIQLKGLRPDIKIVLMSAFETSSLDLNKYPIDEFIPKPITPTRFCEIVAKHLISSSSSRDDTSEVNMA
jgi:DNA-binding NtrC family response regulator